MKKSIVKTLIMLITIILVTACEDETIMISKSLKLVGFSTTSVIIPESQTGDIPIFLGATAGKSVTVTLEVSTEGISSPAVEGTDFTISTKTPELTTGDTEITITTIDNDVFTGDKSFDLIIAASENYQTAAENTIRVTISDDEHPLKNWLGTYSVAAVSYGDDYYGEAPGSWDEAWTVTISPVPDKLDQVTMVGVAGSAEPLLATIDSEGLTITIVGGQNIGDTYGWGDVFVYKGYANMTYSDTDPLTGTVENNGTILVDEWCHFNDGWIWDVFNTTWTKQ